MSTALVQQQGQIVQRGDEPMELSCQEVIRQVRTIQEVMGMLMKQDEHYGVIPGCKKPSLWKPGAEKLSFVFRLAPRFEGEDHPIDLGNGHREYVIKCEIYHITSGRFLGSGLGSCSTMEGKYRFRGGEKTFTGTPVPKEYWTLRNSDPEAAKKLIGGKGFGTAKNEDSRWEIVMIGDKVEHDNPADFYNTVLKMAKKRAHVDAVLTVTAASDIFTQDVEDLPDAPPSVPEYKGNTVPAASLPPSVKATDEGAVSGTAPTTVSADATGKSPAGSGAEPSLPGLAPAVEDADGRKKFMAMMKSLVIHNKEAYYQALQSIGAAEGYKHAKEVPESRWQTVLAVVRKAVTEAGKR